MFIKTSRILRRQRFPRRHQHSMSSRRLLTESLENRLVPSADLVTVLVDAPSIGSQNHGIPVETQVDNLGTSHSRRFDVRYVISLDATLDPADRTIMKARRPALAAGDSDSWTQLVKLPKNMPPGQFYIGAIVDSLGRISESDETNNALTDASVINVLPGLPLGECQTHGHFDNTQYEEGVNCRVMDVEGYPRSFIVYIPEGVLEAPADGQDDDQELDDVPAVFMFHGSTGTGEKFLNISGWREQADEEGLIAVFPTSAMYCRANAACEDGALAGWATKWHSFGLEQSEDFNFDVLPPQYPDGASWLADDVQFVDQMLDHLEESLPVDMNRIYASGFSNGAGFASRLAMEMSDQFAAVAYVGGGIQTGGLDIPSPPEPIPVFAVIGSRDDGIVERLGLAPDDEVPMDPDELLPLIEDSIANLLDVYQLDYDPEDFQPDFVYRDPVSTMMTWYTPTPGTPSGNSFQLAIWDDLVHHYPNGYNATKNPQAFEAADSFWEFFELHSK